MESERLEMRNIQDIIDELQAHPDCLILDVHTTDYCVEFINDRIMDEYSEVDMTDEQLEQLLISREDLTSNDIKTIKTYVENSISSLWNNYDGGIYPELYELEDLNTKVSRQAKILNILS